MFHCCLLGKNKTKNKTKTKTNNNDTGNINQRTCAFVMTPTTNFFVDNYANEKCASAWTCVCNSITQ